MYVCVWVRATCFVHVQFPSEKVAHAAHVLRTVLMTSAPYMIRDRKFHLRTYRRCMVGSEMTDWLLSQNTLVQTRQQGVGMWQVLLEEGVLVHGNLDFHLHCEPKTSVLD